MSLLFLMKVNRQGVFDQHQRGLPRLLPKNSQTAHVSCVGVASRPRGNETKQPSTLQLRNGTEGRSLARQDCIPSRICQLVNSSLEDESFRGGKKDQEAHLFGNNYGEMEFPLYLPFEG